MRKIQSQIKLGLVFLSLLLSLGGKSQSLNEGFERAFPPVGWLVEQNDCGEQVYWWQSNGESDVCNGDFSALILGSDVICGIAEDWLVTPQLAPSSTDHIFNFTMHQSYIQEHGSIYTLRVSTNSATIFNDFTIVHTWNESQMPLSCTSISFDFGSYIGDSIYIAFVMENDAGDNWVIDDVNGLPLVENCYPPTGLETYDVISTSAGLRWQNIDTVPLFYWEIVPKDNAEGVGVVKSSYVSDSFDVAYGLQLSTDYDYRVRSLCSSGDTSYYSTPFSFVTLGSPPSNDECDNSINLMVNTDNSCDDILSGTNLDATKSMDGCIGEANDDVWYKFVAAATKHNIQVSNITAVKGMSIDIVIELFEGDCSSLNSLYCSDDNYFDIENLIIGQTYFIRIYSKYNTSNQSFDICIKTPPNAPPNDDCENAINIIINEDENCQDFISGTTLGATETMAGCIGNADDDVWFSFIATSVKHNFKVSNVVVVEGNNADMIHEVFSGFCNALNSIKCSDLNNSSVTGLVIGDTYYVRVYSKYNTSRQEFDFCITTPPLPPVNDICATALDLNIGDYGTCNLNKVSASTENATNTLYGSCDNNGSDPDLWYRFVAPFSGDYSFASIIGKPGLSLYAGNCDNLNEISCINNTDGILKNLISGDTYYVRIYTDFPETNVEFCIEKDQSPENNYCFGAKLLQLGQGYCENVAVGTNQYATDSQELPGPNCGNYNGGDIWYKLIVPNSGSIEVEMSRNDGFIDGAIAAYSGNCSNLTLLECDDDSNSNSSTSNMPYLSLKNLVSNDTIYIRVWEYGNNEHGDFSICAWESKDISISLGGDCVEGQQTEISFDIGNVYSWVGLKDASGSLIAFIYPNGNELGVVTPKVFTRSTLPLRSDDKGIMYVNRDIQIEVQNEPTGNNPLIRLLYTNTELNDLIDNDGSIVSIDEINMTKTETVCTGEFANSGAFYYQIANDTVNSAGGSYLEFSIPEFSTFYTHGGDIALPISILELIGRKKDEGNELHCRFTTDVLLRSIILERSRNGKNNWEYIYEKSSFGKDYFVYEDKDPFANSFYRLKSVDNDGNFQFSKVITIDRRKVPVDILVYPNPSNNVFNLFLGEKKDSISEILIYSINGEIVKKINTKLLNDNNRVKINLSNKNPGVYYLKFISSLRITMKRIVLIK